MAKLTTCLVLTGRAQEASEFYCTLFGSEITQTVPDGQGGVMLCTFTLAGHDVVVLNGTAPDADIQSQRVTLQVHVDGPEEFDRYWYRLGLVQTFVTADAELGLLDTHNFESCLAETSTLR